ncbi:MAG: hypothetical protein JJU06_07385 [Ectothiorhodospiraceae bacterium]|nr:hypothetical protein [Ectothiorhodospiraceae bacterium]MCH8505645.1 hypothetical protein [Ectothiorhodospiraceae bacterium]
MQNVHDLRAARMHVNLDGVERLQFDEPNNGVQPVVEIGDGHNKPVGFTVAPGVSLR